MDDVGGNVKHGHAFAGAHTREYVAWTSAKARCNDASREHYAYYGGRGIRMCERWESSFENFLADMGQAPSGTSLDRYPNQDGNYEPGNCRWATKKEQQRNMRSNRIVEYGGRSQPVSAWAEETGIHKDTLIYRIDTDWPIERLFSPATRTGRNVK